ncbi:unnamed protein product [Aphanomyces euteiches]
MTGSWRQEVSPQTRNAVINEMCTQLLRLHGESDKEKLQQSVMKYERAVWSKANDKEMYLKTLKNKLLSFKQRQPTKEATPVSPVVLTAGDNESPQVKPPPATDVSMGEMDMAPFLEQLPVSLPQAEMDPAAAKLHQQYQQQRVEMIKNQQSETQKCCQAQMMQQSQMTTAHIQQNTPMAARHLQMTMLQLQHEVARNSLMQHHINQQNSLIQQHYQQLAAMSNQEISI